MNTYNSFNELAAANIATPLVSDMSVFNAGALSGSLREWLQQWLVSLPQDQKFRKAGIKDDIRFVNDVTFKDVLQAVIAGNDIQTVIGIPDSGFRVKVFQELAERAGIDYDTLHQAYAYGDSAKGEQAKGVLKAKL